MDDTEIQHGFRKMSREISRLKSKARSAYDLQVAAQVRAHDLKLRAKTAEFSLRGLCQREQKMLELLKRWMAEGTEDYSLAIDTENFLKTKATQPR